ncbi:YdbC family protein [Succinispira mobilis]|uniref:YdbC family protein n=1 Tax=Succinispira mobilis TaxID=78120 RepID=UPI00037195F0|nr:PC4/YdbC family ssDNA-binding protein [Succinispira mobilis]
MAEIKYEIKEKFGILSESAKGWTKELNLVSWNDKEPKYDLREWDSNHEKMSKGITLSKEELIKLREIVNDINLFNF